MKVYIGTEYEKLPDNFVEFNDRWYNLKTSKLFFNGIPAEVQRLIESIDGVIGDTPSKLYSKRTKETFTSTENLSTGCKTALNCLMFPGYVFNVAECGDNALRETLKIRSDLHDKEPGVYFAWTPLTIRGDVENDFELHARGKVKKFETYSDLYDYFRNRIYE